MFRLPVCPYCRTVYSYKDVKNNKDKNIECYHCKKVFRRSVKNYIIPVFMVILLTIILNVLIFSGAEVFADAMISVSIVSVIAVILLIIVLPFFVKYKREDNK